MNRLSSDSLKQALGALAGFLEADGAAHETFVVIGGGALLALGIVSRTTKDVDILAAVDPERGLVDPRPMSPAAKVAREMQLDPHWLNTGPADQVLAGLPEGFLSRLTRHDYGAYLTIYLPDRLDLIHLKLFAIMDQGPGRHVADLQKLSPTDDELLLAARRVLRQDAGEAFPQIVTTALKALGYGHLVERL